MTVLGPSTDAELFLRSLDEKKLVDLAADLLYVRGHSEVRIMDGPGDGGRDIHSVDQKDDGYLTQSKFHRDPSKAVSSSELWDVVRGMIKFGYTRGCFITNARISPQAKRECLSDYPGYSVDFVDGTTLAREVLGNIILRALWYDGDSIDRVSYVVVIPAVARDLEKDKPLPLLRNRQRIYEGDTLTVGDSKTQWSLHRASIDPHALEPYRRPTIRTVSEVGWASIGAAEVVLSGVLSLDDVPTLQERVAVELLHYVRDSYGQARGHFAVRMGRPSLSPLRGESAGTRIELEDLKPVTFVHHGSIADYELGWIRPSPEAGWFAPRRFNTSASDWVRWYSPRIDACFDVTLSSPPSAISMGVAELQREYYLKWWHESLFVLLPRSAKSEWDVLDLQQADFSAYWGERDLLCAWLHPCLRPGFHPMPIQPDEELENEVSDQNDPSMEQAKVAREYLDDLKQKLTDLEARVLEPAKARHMIAVVDQDPFPSTDLVEYRSVDLLRDPDIIPSPIDPTSRKVRVTVCWLLQEMPADDVDCARLQEVMTEIAQRRSLPFAALVEPDFNTRARDCYLLGHLAYQGPVGFDSSSDLLAMIETAAGLVLDEMEEQIRETHGSVRRATRKYWDDELFILLPESAPQ